MIALSFGMHADDVMEQDSRDELGSLMEKNQVTGEDLKKELQDISTMRKQIQQLKKKVKQQKTSSSRKGSHSRGNNSKKRASSKENESNTKRRKGYEGRTIIMDKKGRKAIKMKYIIVLH